MPREFDFVFTSKPINQTAKNVLCKGEHFESQIKTENFHSENPIPIKYFEGKSEDDLTGRKTGRLKVVGFLGKNQNSNYGVWLVRCDCGHYETRRSKTIKKNKNDDMCIYCREVHNMRNK